MNLTPDFLTLEDVLDLHAQQLEQYGGSQGVRNIGLLESAVMTPQASFDGEYVHGDLFQMAAAYAFHIAENQPLVDGNKRTGLASCLVFLAINGYEVPDPDGATNVDGPS
jgi:death-on-curing protein